MTVKTEHDSTQLQANVTVVVTMSKEDKDSWS
jgi:hypothetical protein